MKTANEMIEEAVGNLYAGFNKLRQAKQYQEEYDAMNILMNMLASDRQYMRENYKIEI